jgi:hypothetical protein
MDVAGCAQGDPLFQLQIHPGIVVPIAREISVSVVPPHVQFHVQIHVVGGAPATEPAAGAAAGAGAASAPALGT